MSHFLPMSRLFIYPTTSAAKTEAFGQRANLREIKATPLHGQNFGAWRAVSRSRIIDPIFFYGTINSELYYEVIIYHI